MKKIIYLILLLLLIFTLYNKEYVVPTQTKDYLNYDDFIKLISTYKSIKLENIHLYYQEYLNQNYKNYIHLINKVNYPNFLDINEKCSYNVITKPIMLINKKFKLDKNYFPSNLKIVKLNHIERIYDMLIDKETEENLKLLFAYLDSDLTIFSTYRPFSLQEELFNNRTDELVAEAGCSEHQSGLAVDISLRSIGLTYCLEKAEIYSLLYNNSYKYGFILRYPKDKEQITGFAFEPWHYRYVGKEIAEVIYKQELTLEEYFYYYVPLVL